MYLRAERDVSPAPPWHTRFADVTEDDAYAVQSELIRLHLASGATLAGWKIGATNPGAQAAFGLREPVYGRLLAERRLTDGATVPMATLIHPRIECEVAFVLADDLRGPGVTPDAALAAVQGVQAAFEIVDARTTGWVAKMAEMIADNVFQARYVLSDHLVPASGLDLASLEVTLFRNGQEAARGRGASVLGSPVNALTWIANRIAAHGHTLQAGQVVLAGSLTPLVPCAPGEAFEAVFEHIGSIRVSFA